MKTKYLAYGLIICSMAFIGCRGKSEREKGYDQGYQQGYNETYSGAYNNGVADGEAAGQTEGFDDGYAVGYDAEYTNGYNQAFQDFVSQDYLDGYAVGDAAGYSDGFDVGESDGLVAGDSQGYNDGYNQGNSDGYADGYDDGYDDEYSYAYNSGYNSGSLSGSSAGSSDGSADGATDGYNDGYDDGYEDGEDDYFAYNDGYADGYEDYYSDGYDDGYYEGYDDGYYDGVGSNTRSSDPMIQMANSINRDIVDYKKLPKFTKAHARKMGGIAVSHSNQGSHDREKYAALKERFYVGAIASQLKSRFNLKDKSAMKVALVVNNYNKQSNSRALTPEDASSFTMGIAGVDMQEIMTAVEDARRGETKGLTKVLSTTAKTLDTDPENLNRMISTLFF